MVAIDSFSTRMEELVHAVYANKANDWKRPHMGASVIGHPCDRFVWLSFRWASPPQIDARIHRLFDSGYQEEARIIKDLRTVGLEVHDKDPDTGGQIRFSALGGHLSGSVDGVVRGVPDAEKSWHILECKTMNKKHFDAMLKSCVKDAKPQHYAQMQCYMRGIGLERALYAVTCKDDDRMYFERVHHDKKESQALFDRAQRLIFGHIPAYQECDECAYCQHRPVCQENAQPSRNCRTCALSEPQKEGGWKCNNGTPLSQIATVGCNAWVSVTNPGVAP